MAKRKTNFEKELLTDLMDQLDENGMAGKHYDNLIEDYLELFRLKNILIEDLQVNGLRIRYLTGNGFESEKPNESLERLVKVNAQMLKILGELDLKKPKVVDEDDLL
ncbi:RNA polymerase subunit sigma-70 [Alkalibacter mobilis]|uniref:RNA polymerase subunit sigma-70 n=1 Tax=Alkalibacter mobilis TaxID=2787712 RepID=UPI0018A033B2|nr:RNA polymerase subunit sigma-70 [Alkalibacter mobilis]MBF7097586.1 RNA polymerase subunit sigma-70 [Alkalibacter mobilis]